MNKFYIVDAPCGAGKTTAAINLMNNNKQSKYMFITPFLTEVERIKQQCNDRKFYEPQQIQTKLNGIHWLLSNNKNITSTHALFLYFNEYTADLIRQGEYTLILDEVANVVDILDISKHDLQTILEKYAHIDDGLLIWDDETYEGKFENIKKWSLNRCIGIYGDKVLIWCFPIDIFNAFKEVYILTYMFNCQIQRYYYDFYNINYKHIGVVNFKFTYEATKYDIVNKYKNKIYIIDNDKLNCIGETDNALSVSWFTRDKLTHNKPMINNLKNNIGNYFKNIVKSPSNNNMWTTFKDYKKILQGSGYTKGFVAVNARATNDYIHKNYLAYCANIFINPVLKQFFAQKDIIINEDAYALSEMLQWIFRSAIRKEESIHIYIPSSRMRNLLIKWLNNKL
jgi:hypothetical protein